MTDVRFLKYKTRIFSILSINSKSWRNILRIQRPYWIYLKLQLRICCPYPFSHQTRSVGNRSCRPERVLHYLTELPRDATESIEYTGSVECCVSNILFFFISFLCLYPLTFDCSMSNIPRCFRTNLNVYAMWRFILRQR